MIKNTYNIHYLRKDDKFMNFKKMATTALISAMTMTSLTSIPAFAATSKITSAKVTVEAEFTIDEKDYTLNADTDSSKYNVDSCTLTSSVPSKGWSDSSNPKIKIVLQAEDNYKWDTKIDKNDVTIDGVEGEVKSVKASNKKLTINYTITGIEDDGSDNSGDYDLSVYNLGWDEAIGQAYWDGSEDAKKYEVKLYRGSTLVATKTTTNTEYNFGNLFDKSGKYTFKVRAFHGNKKGTVETSDELELDSDEAKEIRENYEENKSSSSGPSKDTSSQQAADAANGSTGPTVGGNIVANDPSKNTFGPSVGGATANAAAVQQGINDNVKAAMAEGNYTNNGLNTANAVPANGTWTQQNGIWKFQLTDGSFATSWQYINGQWYFFDNNGNMYQGSVCLNNQWYRFDDVNGNLRLGWYKSPENGKWYYYNMTNGTLVAGQWITDNGKMYLLAGDGTMYENTVTPDGHTVDASGAMVA